MPDPIIDREALIGAAAKAGYELGSDRTWAEYARRSPVWADGDMDTAATMLPVIAAGVLAPLRARHRPTGHGCIDCYGGWDCPEADLLDAIEAAVKGGE